MVSACFIQLGFFPGPFCLRDLERYAGMSVDAIAVEVNQQVVLQVESSALLKLQSCSVRRLRFTPAISVPAPSFETCNRAT